MLMLPNILLQNAEGNEFAAVLYEATFQEENGKAEVI